ncbi:MAG: NAD(P)-dependent oxidoreductase, partial [Pseudomonadota bacterium]
MTDQKTIFIFGAGFSGKAYAEIAISSGARVFGTTRSIESAAKLQTLGILPIVFEGSIVSDEL